MSLPIEDWQSRKDRRKAFRLADSVPDSRPFPWGLYVVWVVIVSGSAAALVWAVGGM